MTIFSLEWKLLREDALKISCICIVYPLCTTLLLLHMTSLFDGLTLHQAFTALLGHVEELTWMYWTLLWFGYVILIQIIWKPRSTSFSYNMLLRYPTKSWFWLNRLLILLIFTACYVAITYIMCFFLFLKAHVTLQFDILIVLQAFFLLINMYCHALLWKIIELLFSAKIATVLLIVLFFAGIKRSAPYIPFYYGLMGNFDANMFAVILVIEGLFICLMCLFIVRIGLKNDYYYGGLLDVD